jgi:hypothetical protein
MDDWMSRRRKMVMEWGVDGMKHNKDTWELGRAGLVRRLRHVNETSVKPAQSIRGAVHNYVNCTTGLTDTRHCHS